MCYIDVHEATKTLNSNMVLNTVSLKLCRGSVVGLQGHNGSGKTMLLRAIAGLITLDSGTICIDGKRMGQDITFPPSMGLIIENAGVWNHMTGVESLCLLADINRKIGKNDVRKAIKRVGLNPDDKRKFGKYSLGMKRRLVLAQAIMERPDLILLDEPTNALDPEGIAMAHDVILSEKKRGAAIILASHSAEDVNVLCDVIYTMSNGRLEMTYE